MNWTVQNFSIENTQTTTNPKNYFSPYYRKNVFIIIFILMNHEL